MKSETMPLPYQLNLIKPARLQTQKHATQHNCNCALCAGGRVAVCKKIQTRT